MLRKKMLFLGRNLLKLPMIICSPGSITTDEQGQVLNICIMRIDPLCKKT